MLRFFTAGESHGQGLIGIIVGLAAGIRTDTGKVELDLFRRQQGYGRGERMKIEKDKVEIKSGLINGETIGAPLALWIENKDWENWKNRPREKNTIPRPGHADLAGLLKYGLDDIQSVIERASARETAMRVAIGSAAKQFLQNFGIELAGHVIEIGGVSLSVKTRQRLSLKQIRQKALNSP